MTGTDVALAGRTDLVIDPNQHMWTDDQLAVIRQIGTQNATPADLKLFFHQCVRTGLDPFARQIYLVEYGGKATIQTGIDGFRVVARRAADQAAVPLAYEDTKWCGPDGKWVDVWLSVEPPAAARAAVIRGGERFSAVCVFAEFVGTKREYGPDKRPTGRMVPNSMWTSKPAHMIGKCAEAAALRKAFPQDLGGVYIGEEMDHRATVQGEVVVESTQSGAPGEHLVHATELVAAATTEDELKGVWERFSPSLGVEERSRLSAAVRGALARLVTDAAAHQDGPADPTTDEPDVEGCEPRAGTDQTATTKGPNPA